MVRMRHQHSLNRSIQDRMPRITAPTTSHRHLIHTLELVREMVIRRSSKCLLAQAISNRFHRQDFKLKEEAPKAGVRDLVQLANHPCSHHMDNSKTRTTFRALKPLKPSRCGHQAAICWWTIQLVGLALRAQIAPSSVRQTTSQHLAHPKFDNRSPEYQAGRTTNLAGPRVRNLQTL